MADKVLPLIFSSFTVGLILSSSATNDEDRYVTDRERERRERQREVSERQPRRERTALTINEVCERNHVCRDFIYAQIRAGRLRAHKFGRVTRIFSDDEEAWQNSLPTLGGGAAA